MIDRALKVIVYELNQFLRLRHDLNESKVLLNSIVDQDGKMATNDENKLIFSLIDIAQETTMKNSTPSVGAVSRDSRELHLNLFVLASAFFNPANYDQGLKYISSVISFFNAKPIFNQSNSPALSGSGVDRLVFEMFDVDSNTKNNVWSTIGAKYMPSVIYKVRMLTITDDAIRSQVDGIRAVDLDKDLS